MFETTKSIIIPDQEWKKIEDYTRLWPDEVACLGYAKLEGSNVIVDEVFLVPQVAHLGGVEFMEKGFPYAIDKAVKEDRLHELKFCWHSHATHEAFWSATDEDMIDKVHASGPIDWFASAVLNKKGNVWGQLDHFCPEGDLGKFVDHVTIPLDIAIDGRVNEDELRLKEMEELVEKKVWTTNPKAGAASKHGTTKRGESSRTGARTDTGIDEFQPLATAADWKLHREAKNGKWECYVDNQDVAHYWHEHNGDDGGYMGSAVIPKKSDGSYAIELNVTVLDSTAEEEQEALDEAAELMSSVPGHDEPVVAL